MAEWHKEEISWPSSCLYCVLLTTLRRAHPCAMMCDKRLGLNENMFNIRIRLANGCFQAVDSHLHLSRRKIFVEVQIQRQQNVVWAEIHRQRAGHLLNRRVGFGDGADARYRLTIRALAYQQAFTLIGQ